MRERGHAEAVGEREPDLAALAAPVFGRAAELIAIVGLQGPASRLSTARRRAVRPPLLAAAAAISRAVGGPGPPAPRLARLGRPTCPTRADLGRRTPAPDPGPRTPGAAGRR